jgi:hypothetical protein
MDCHVADAPRNDGHFRNDESNSRHCEAEGRGNPRSPGAWIATSLTLLAMTATFAMTSQIAVIARPPNPARYRTRTLNLTPSLRA